MFFSLLPRSAKAVLGKQIPVTVRHNTVPMKMYLDRHVGLPLESWASRGLIRNWVGSVGKQRVYTDMSVMDNDSWEGLSPYRVFDIVDNSESNHLERKDQRVPIFDEKFGGKMRSNFGVDCCDSYSPKNVNNDLVVAFSRDFARGGCSLRWKSDLLWTSFEEGEIVMISGILV
ncbi:hypothetical protein Tco_1371089 [Tanacetum coccineum]